MTTKVTALAEVASDYDAIVLDQWGVLHDGSAPYPGAVSALEALHDAGHRLAVLSNSGKRSGPNANRIAMFGFGQHLFDEVMTSGEALWRDIEAGRVPERRFFPIERAEGDAAIWASALDGELVPLDKAEAILLMGLPDGTTLSDWQTLLGDARARDLPVYCSNPDKASPRAGGLVISPGALADAYERLGGGVTYYGKPHRPIFDALQTALEAKRLLMVGDSLEHDIAGGAGAGWDTMLVQGGLYATDFAQGDADETLARLCHDKAAPTPTYRIETLK